MLQIKLDTKEGRLHVFVRYEGLHKITYLNHTLNYRWKEGKIVDSKMRVWN